MRHAQSFDLFLEPGLAFGDWLEIRRSRLARRGLSFDWELRSSAAGG